MLRKQMNTGTGAEWYWIQSQNVGKGVIQSEHENNIGKNKNTI
jgi:hypothetical protein